jgi:hypothetical protein
MKPTVEKKMTVVKLKIKITKIPGFPSPERKKKKESFQGQVFLFWWECALDRGRRSSVWEGEGERRYSRGTTRVHIKAAGCFLQGTLSVGFIFQGEVRIRC